MTGLSLAQSRVKAEVGEPWTSDDASQPVRTEAGHAIKIPAELWMSDDATQAVRTEAGNEVRVPEFLTVTISSPVTFQTFQRNGSNQADIPVTCNVSGGGGRAVQARWGTGAWSSLGTTDASGNLTGTLSSQPVGQNTLQVRTTDSMAIASVLYVGVGDVFAIWGQSNGGGRGTTNQSYSHATLKAVLYGNDYAWKELADPTDSNSGQVDSISSDNDSEMGSVWPLVSTTVMATTGFPIAFVPCCKGATGFGASQPTWIPTASPLDRTTLFGSALYRTQQSGARAVLWWNGEGGFDEVSGDTYVNAFQNMTTTARATLATLQFIPCKIQECVGILSTKQDNLWNAQGRLWAENPHVLTGPTLADTPTGSVTNILTEYEGGAEPYYHLKSSATLQTAADRWAARLLALFPI